MKKTTPTISVVYLSSLPYGIDYFKNFVDSYVAHNAGYIHDLIIAFSGSQKADLEKKNAFLQYLQDKNISNFTELKFEGGQDIEIYGEIASTITTDFVLFFNTYTQILKQDWLKFYIENFDDSTGVIGASGSNQSYWSAVFQLNPIFWERKKSISDNIKKYKLFLKAIFYWRFLFKPFPNPHLRTTAFMVRPQQFLQIKCKPITSKFKAYQFENGRNSMTNQVLKMKLHVKVIDNEGRPYLIENWKNSYTFWRGNQEKLLVLDNQSLRYSNADKTEKIDMQKLAWGTD